VGRESAVGYRIVTYHVPSLYTYHATYHVPIVVPKWYTLDTLSLRTHTYTMVCCHVLGDGESLRLLLYLPTTEALRSTT